MQVQDVSVVERAERGDTLAFDTARVHCDHLGSARWGRNEMREARHSSTDVLDLNLRRKPWPHEPGQAQPDKLGPQTHVAHPHQSERATINMARAAGLFTPKNEGASTSGRRSWENRDPRIWRAGDTGRPVRRPAFWRKRVNVSVGRIIPPFGARAKRSKAGSMSAVARTGMTLASSPSDSAAASIDRMKKLDCGDASGLNMTPTRARRGEISLSRSSHLPPIENSNMLNPIRLPPGRVTGSAPVMKTIGIVAVAAFAACAEAGPPVAARTVTRLRTRSATSAGSRSYRYILAFDLAAFLQALMECCHRVGGIAQRPGTAAIARNWNISLLRLR